MMRFDVKYPAKEGFNERTEQLDEYGLRRQIPEINPRIFRAFDLDRIVLKTRRHGDIVITRNWHEGEK